MPFESTSTVPTPLIDFVETVSLPVAVVLAAAEALSEELLLPPQATRPMATSAITATVSSGARLRFIFSPLLCVGPNVFSSTQPASVEIE